MKLKTLAADTPPVSCAYARKSATEIADNFKINKATVPRWRKLTLCEAVENERIAAEKRLAIETQLAIRAVVDKATVQG